MSEPVRRYQAWLVQLETTLQHINDRPLESVVQLMDTVAAVAKASADLTAFESRLFIETFFRQQQSAELPSLWPEGLWQQLSEITDKTQVEWLELSADLAHQGIYLQGELVGMGEYHCLHCGQVQAHYHPGQLLECSQCQQVRFLRQGLPV